MSPILIAGFHRSGTSAVARAVHRAGVHLGDDLLGATRGNPHGHFEDRSVVELHDRILHRSGRTWKSLTPVPRPLASGDTESIASLVTSRDVGGQPWGVKDPRLCLFLSEWLMHAPDAKVIVVIRRPGEAIRSLHMRHSRRHVVTRGADPSDLDFWRHPDLGLALWVFYHRELLTALETHAAVHVVDFGDRESFDRLLPTIAERWDLDLDLANEGSSALDPTLGNNDLDPIDVRDRRLLTEAAELWSVLRNRLADH